MSRSGRGRPPKNRSTGSDQPPLFKGSEGDTPERVQEKTDSFGEPSLKQKIVEAVLVGLAPKIVWAILASVVTAVATVAVFWWQFGGKLNLHERRLTDVECIHYLEEYEEWANDCVEDGGTLNEFFVCYPKGAGRPRAFKSSLDEVSDECKERLLPDT